MSKTERFVWALTVAVLVGALISFFLWFPVSNERLLQAEYTYTYKQGREHVADLIGNEGEVRAEVWFDYDLGRRVYLVKVGGKNEFQDDPPKSWWRERRVKDE